MGQTMLVGTGDALDAALEDKRTVVKVDWYTIPLAGLAGQLGVVHSLLSITVDGHNESPHIYAIEKTLPALDSEEKLFPNGVYVSDWVDVAPRLLDAPIHTLECDQIEGAINGRVCGMRTLHQLAVDLGPYNVSSCNCHHAALAIYNAIAIDEAKLLWMPNEIHIKIAVMFQRLGIDVCNLEAGVESTSGSVAGSVARSTSQL